MSLRRWWCRHVETHRTTVDGRLVGYTCAACDTLLPLDVADPEKWARTLARRQAADEAEAAHALYLRWQRRVEAEADVVPLRRRKY